MSQSPFALTTAATVTRQLAERFTDRNVMALPRLQKITVSVGLGHAKESPKLTETATETLRAITGQQPTVTKAKKAIAGFKLRQGEVVGLRVTLRGARMWEFLNRLIAISIPRLRDFHGLSRSKIDGQGNYSFGIREHTVFPEVREENLAVVHGVGIVVTTTATNRTDGEALLEALGLPLEVPQTVATTTRQGKE